MQAPFLLHKITKNIKDISHLKKSRSSLKTTIGKRRRKTKKRDTMYPVHPAFFARFFLQKLFFPKLAKPRKAIHKRLKTISKYFRKVSGNLKNNFRGRVSFLFGIMRRGRKLLLANLQRARKEYVFLKTRHKFSLIQGAVVFALFLAVVGFSGNHAFLQYKMALLESKTIRDVAVKQTGSAIAQMPVTYTVIVSKSVITKDHYVVQLPKGASNVALRHISSQKARVILAKAPSNDSALTTAKRQELVGIVAENHQSIFTKISRFILANVSDAMSELVALLIPTVVGETNQLSEDPIVEDDISLQPELIQMPEASFVDVSDALQNPVLESPVPTVPEPESQPEPPALPDVNAPENPIVETDENFEPFLSSYSSLTSLTEILADVTPTTVSRSDELIIIDDQLSTQDLASPASPALSDTEEFIQIDYQLPAPQITEQDTDQGKEVVISAPDEDPQQPLTNVLAFTTIPEFFKVGQEDKIQITWRNNDGQVMPFTAHDLDNNGKLDYVEWTVPHLSSQTFDIIFISKAFLLNENKEIIEDIYDQLRYKDDIWQTVQENQYVRVTFETTLTNKNDITVYAKPQDPNNPTQIEVYPKDSDQLITTFQDMGGEDFYKVLLTNLQTPTDVFDLKIIGGDVDIDFIVDANRYWVGSAGGNTNDTANWASADPASCTGGGASVPGASDIAIFDSDCDNSATINADFSVIGININSGYAGTITQNSGINVTVGTSDFIQAGGTYTMAGSDLLTITGSAADFTKTGGTFNEGTGTLVFSGSGSSTLNVDTTETFNNVTVNKTSSGSLTISSGDTMVVSSTLTLTDGAINTGTIDARGDITQASTSDNGSAILDFGNDALAQTYTINGGGGVKVRFNSASDASDSVVFNADGSLNGIDITSGFSGTVPMTYNGFNLTLRTGDFTQAAGTFNASAIFTLGTSSDSGADFIKTGGTFVEGTGSVVFGGNASAFDVATTETFYNVTINKTSGFTLTISSGDTMVVSNTLTLTNGAVDTGTIDARGNITSASTFGSSGQNAGGTAILDFGNDSLAQTYTLEGGYGLQVRFDSAADASDAVVLNADTGLNGISITSDFSGTVPMTYNGFNLTIRNGDFTQAAGTFNAPATMTFGGATAESSDFIKTGGTFNEGTGTMVFRGESSTINVVTTETFYNVTVNLVNTGVLTIASGDTMVVSNTLTLTNGTVDTGTIDARGNITSASTFGSAGAGAGGNAILDFGNDSLAQTYTLEGGYGLQVRFDSAADASDAVVLNADTGLNGISITSDFSGTVPMTYNGFNLTIRRGDFTQAAGTFNAPATMTFGGATAESSDFIKTGGTFNEGTGTMVFRGQLSTFNVVTTETFYNVTVNLVAGGTMTIASGDTMVVSNTLTLTDGLVATGTLEAQGNVTVASTYDGGSAPLLFSGSATQSFDLTGATGLYNADISVNKSGGQVNLLSALVMDAASQDLTIIEGTFDINANALTVNGTSGTLIIQDGGNLQLRGDETITANASNPQLQSGSTVTYDGTSGPYTLKDYTYSNLSINGSGATFNLPGTKSVNNLTITAGTLDVTATPYNLNVAGNWSNFGAFTPRSGTVTFNGTNQSILGSTTFNNFSKTESTDDSSDVVLTFANTGTQTVSGLLTLDGLDDTDRINLVSDSPGTRWSLISSGTRAIDYVDAQDSDASGGATITHANTVSSGNNLNWGFGTAPSFSAGPSDGSSSSTTPTNAGNNVTFSATATDTESDNYYLAICKTDAITPNASAAPTCDGGNWAISSSTASGAQASVTYTTLTGDTESNTWYAFVCDNNIDPLCSSSSQGSGDSGSPFAVNHTPSFTTISDTSGYIKAGDAVTFTTTASDADTNGSADTVQLFVCKGNDFTGTACGGAGTWCSSSASASNPTCDYTVLAGDGDATQTYYGNIIDNHSFQSTSNPRSSTFSTDVTKPTTSDDYGANDDVWQDTSQTITLTPADATSGVASTQYCTDSSDACDPTTGTSYTAGVLIATEGITYFRYASTDNAGNVQTTVSRTVKIDTTAPSTTADAGAYVFGATSTSNVTVTLLCTDASGSGCSFTLYCVDTANACIPATTYSAPVVVSSQGTSYMRYSSTDTVVNSETADSQTIVISTDGGGSSSSGSSSGSSTYNPNPPPPVPASHTVCNASQQCISIDGAGPDQCQANNSYPVNSTYCNTLRYICSYLGCSVLGIDLNQCQANTDCATPKHTVCSNKSCVVVDGLGTNQCISNSDCGVSDENIGNVSLPGPTHSSPIDSPNSALDSLKEVLEPSNIIQNIENVSKDVAIEITSFSNSIPAKIISTTGVSFSLLAIVTSLFASPLSFPEIFLIPMRMFSLLMFAFGLKKRSRPWGIVYDSVTKQPIDPVYMVLQDIHGKQVATAITDIDGRFGFLVEPGKYRIIARKANYVFPSKKLAGRTGDELYDNLYFGEEIEIKKQEDVIIKNIPLDALRFDFNEFAKKDKNLMTFYSRWDLMVGRISNVLFVVGFIVAIIAFFFAPYPYNLIIFSLYLAILLLRILGIKPKLFGHVIDKNTGRPLSFAIIRVILAGSNVEVTHKITDKYGRYYCLVPNGKYYVKIENKNPDGSYSLIYTSSVIDNSKEGVIRKMFRV